MITTILCALSFIAGVIVMALLQDHVERCQRAAAAPAGRPDALSGAASAVAAPSRRTMEGRNPMPRSDPKHLAFVRSQPCCVPGCTRTPVQPHHVRTAANSGTALKPPDTETVPLCVAHHAEGHRTGWRTFEDRHGVDLAWHARDMAKMAQAPEGLF